MKDEAADVMRVRVTKKEFRNWYHVGDEHVVLKAVKFDGESGFFPLVDSPECGIGLDHCEVLLDEPVVPDVKSLDSHYSFEYALSEADKEAGSIRIDPYFVNRMWGLSAKDDTGVVFHLLKTLARYSDKNTKQREITAMYKSIKRLAELEGVELK